MIREFARYLAPVTGQRYRGGQLEGALPRAVTAADGTELPLDLLSTGTAGGVALALRLAMAGYLLGGSGGFMVMDDPLVDFDPQRRAGSGPDPGRVCCRAAVADHHLRPRYRPPAGRQPDPVGTGQGRIKENKKLGFARRRGK